MYLFGLSIVGTLTNSQKKPNNQNYVGRSDMCGFREATRRNPYERYFPHARYFHKLPLTLIALATTSQVTKSQGSCRPYKANAPTDGCSLKPWPPELGTPEAMAEVLVHISGGQKRVSKRVCGDPPLPNPEPQTLAPKAFETRGLGSLSSSARAVPWPVSAPRQPVRSCALSRVPLQGYISKFRLRRRVLEQSNTAK